MEYLQLLVSIMDLPEEQKARLVNALAGLCQKSGTGSDYFFEPMDKSITDEGAQAKEYTRITQGEIAKWLYSSVNWGQVYKALIKEGLLIQSPAGLLMKLRRR